MTSETRRRTRRAFLARNAASPKLRGQYLRAVHATRIKREVLEAFSTSDGTSPLAALPAKRRGFAVVAFFALIPLALLGVATAAAMQFAGTVEKLGGVQSTVVVDSVAVQLAEGRASGAISVVPTNTANAQGTIVPVTQPATLPRRADVVFPNLEKKEPFLMLLIGVDSRDGEEEYAHSDTIILAYLDPAAKHVNLMSIPRDLLVQMPGSFGRGKLSDVYYAGERTKLTSNPFPGGGVGLVWETLQLNFGVTINYFAQVDFNGFRKIIDAVDGVAVDNPYTIVDDAYPTEDYQYTRVYFSAGVIHLNGAEALQFARTRHGDGDFQRNARQQQVILAIREQAAKTNLFVQSDRLIEALSGTVKTDFPPKQFLALAGVARGIGNDGIKQYYLNNLLFDTAGPVLGISYIGLDWTEAKKLVREFSSPVVDQNSAMQQQAQGANTALKVVVQNGTTKAQFAKRWSDTLSRQGYGKAEDGYIDAPADKKGKTAQTKVLCFGKNEATARAIAATLGLSPSAVDTTMSRPTETPPGTDILVILGSDAKEP